MQLGSDAFQNLLRNCQETNEANSGLAADLLDPPHLQAMPTTSA